MTAIDAWAFATCTRISGVDHAVHRGTARTLCGRNVNPHGFPAGWMFMPQDSCSCKTCRAVFARQQAQDDTEAEGSPLEQAKERADVG